jgi:hypothetical protein
MDSKIEDKVRAVGKAHIDFRKDIDLDLVEALVCDSKTRSIASLTIISVVWCPL